MEGFFSKEQFQQSGVSKKTSCISCGLFKQCNSPKITPKGEGKLRIMNIAEFPSHADDLENNFFLGKARILKRLYSKYGIDMDEDCINIAALRCHPEEIIPKKMGRYLESCRKYVFQAIEKYQPHVIVLFGNYALQSVIGHRWKRDLGTINKWRGFVIPDQQIKAFICPTFSPAFIYDQEPYYESIFEADIKRISEVVHKQFPVYKEPQIEIVKSLKVLDSIKSGSAAFDYETTGIKPYNAGHKIVCASVAPSADHAYVFMMPEEKKKQNPFLRFVKNQNVNKIAYNMKFEDNWTNVILKRKVASWRWDGQIASHLIDNRPDITSLKFQTYVTFGIIDYDSEISPFLKAKDANSMNKLIEYIKNPDNAKKVMHYCGMDSVLTYRLMEVQTGILGYDFLPF